MAPTFADFAAEIFASTTSRPARRPKVERRDAMSRERLLQRIRAEFQEMPGLQLTLEQAERLFGVREDVCVRLFVALMREGLLCQNSDQQFARRSTPR